MNAPVIDRRLCARCGHMAHFHVEPGAFPRAESTGADGCLAMTAPGVRCPCPQFVPRPALVITLGDGR